MILGLLRQLAEVIQPSHLLYGSIAIFILLAVAAIGLTQSGSEYAARSQLRNLRRIGLTHSNMKDQYDDKYSIPEGAPNKGLIRIKALFVHPIKSCEPVEVESAVLKKSGFVYDRAFSFAVEQTVKTEDQDAGQSKFISQRTKPQMALVKTEIWAPHQSSDERDPLVQAGGCILVTFADPDPATWIKKLRASLEQRKWDATPQCSFVVPYEPTPDQIRQYSLQTKAFTIHVRDVIGLDMGRNPSVGNALPKLQRFLGYSEKHKLQLFKCIPQSLLRTTLNLAPIVNIGSPAVHGFTDQQPIHLNSLASVHAVSTLLPPENRPLNALRFRANVWISGAAAHEEDNWLRCRVAGRDSKDDDASLTISVVCRTSRCTMPNVNTRSGTFSMQTPSEGMKKGKPQPSTALVAHRTVEEGNKAALGYIGMHAVPEDRDLDAAEVANRDVIVRVGDSIEVLKRGDHLYGSTGNDY